MGEEWVLSFMWETRFFLIKEIIFIFSISEEKYFLYPLRLLIGGLLIKLMKDRLAREKPDLYL